MQYTLSETLEDNGPTVFARQVLSKHVDLFPERSALFFTPTANLPKRVVGKGSLDVFLPLCTPDFYECFVIRSYMSPRLWVDLLQRHTGFIRWTPIPNAAVTITRFDRTTIREDHLKAGTKALLDALKVKTNGRRDGWPLFYFGAIIDDAPGFISHSWQQRVVSVAEKAGMRIRVSPTAAGHRSNR